MHKKSPNARLSKCVRNASLMTGIHFLILLRRCIYFTLKITQPSFITASVRCTTGGYIFSLFVSPRGRGGTLLTGLWSQGLSHGKRRGTPVSGPRSLRGGGESRGYPSQDQYMGTPHPTLLTRTRTGYPQPGPEQGTATPQPGPGLDRKCHGQDTASWVFTQEDFLVILILQRCYLSRYVNSS